MLLKKVVYLKWKGEQFLNGDTKSLPVSQLHKISKVKNSNSATQKVWKWESIWYERKVKKVR